MDLKSEILREYSKPQALRIADYIGDNPNRFSQLMTLFMGPEYRVTQRAAWIVSHCCDQFPYLITPHLKMVISNLGTDPNVAVKRNTVRILQFIDIPEDLMGELADHCFKYLNSNTETIAVRVFSMTILLNITKKFPDLKEELQQAIQTHMPYGTAGFISRGKKTLAALEKL